MESRKMKEIMNDCMTRLEAFMLKTARNVLSFDDECMK